MNEDYRQALEEVLRDISDYSEEISDVALEQIINILSRETNPTIRNIVEAYNLQKGE